MTPDPPKATATGREGIRVTAALRPRDGEVLTPVCLAFVLDLVRRYRPRVLELLTARQAMQARYDAGYRPRFLPETRAIRESSFRVAPLPADLQDRRVEITGPVDRKMIINALNSGASVFMADFEDSNSPTWANVIQGQINLRDAVRRTISLSTPTKEYKLNEKTAVLMVRPRGWHLVEKHILVDGEPISASAPGEGPSRPLFGACSPTLLASPAPPWGTCPRSSADRARAF